MHNLEGKRILITGGQSMIGRACAKLLGTKSNIWVTNHSECLYFDEYIPNDDRMQVGVNLLDYDSTKNLIRNIRPDYVIHCAGYNGNISFNSKYPADIYYRTVQMGMNVYRACVQTESVQKVVTPLSSCAYPSTNNLLKEEEFTQGNPHPTVEGHGLAKRVLFDFGRQLTKQHDNIRFVSLIFNTVFGPYDSYDLNKTKVVGALIKKFVDAERINAPVVQVWGTGKPRREIIYCDDAARGIIEVLKSYEDISLPINVGCGYDYSIKDLALIISQASYYTGDICYDTSKPDGQFNKKLDNARMKKLLPEMKFEPITSLYATVEWYRRTFYAN